MKDFIILTSTSGERPIYLNPLTITYIQGYDRYTSVHIIGENGNGVSVRESPEGIFELLSKLEK